MLLEILYSMMIRVRSRVVSKMCELQLFEISIPHEGNPAGFIHYLSASHNHFRASTRLRGAVQHPKLQALRE